MSNTQLFGWIGSIGLVLMLILQPTVDGVGGWITTWITLSGMAAIAITLAMTAFTATASIIGRLFRR